MIDAPRTGAPVLGPDSPTADGSPITDGPSTPLAPSPRGRRGRRAGRRASPWWRVGFPVAMVVLVGAIPVLVAVGARTVLDSNDGRLVNQVTDPAAPGWEAIVDPTPTDLVLFADAAGALQGVSLLVLTGEGSGAVVQVPSETLVETNLGEMTLGYTFFLHGVDGVRAELGELLNLSFDDAQVVTADQWAEVLAPVSPLTVNTPDDVVDADGQRVFPAGSIQVPAAQAPSFLYTRGRGESDLARLVRVEAFWRAWLAAAATGGATAVPAPPDQGLGRFLLTLGGDQVVFETLPVSVQRDPDGGPEVFVADPVATEALVAELVPFPRGAPGQRPTVRVLDGTGTQDHGVQAAILLGAAGAQIEVIGNANEFGVATTEVVYYDEARRADAEALREALGVGEVVKSDQKSALDITVVLGEDAAGLTGAMTAPGAGTVVPDTQPGVGGG